MEAMVSRTDSGVILRLSGGREVRGILLKRTSEALTFEVFGPYPLVEVGERLEHLQVLRAGNRLYTGPVIVSAVVWTAMKQIITAAFIEPWAPGGDAGNAAQLCTEARSLVQSWESSHALVPSYQIAVSNLRAFLSELSGWLSPIDLAITTATPATRDELAAGMAEELYGAIYPRLRQLWARIEESLDRVPLEEAPAHRLFTRRELHPLTMCCPLVHRTYAKPLGYAGDYQMVNMILGNQMEGPSLYAQVVNAYFLRIDVAHGHRNRIEKLVDVLREEAERAAVLERSLRVLNVGCGPAEEICRFIRRSDLADRCEFVLVDFNQETLDYARHQIEAAIRDSGRRPGVKYVNQSVNDLLKDALRSANGAVREEFDLAYCAGLFDYLSDRVCARLVQLLCRRTRGGGRIVATNVHRRHTSRAVLDDLVEWHLIVRDDADMHEMAPGGMGEVVVGTEAAGVNLFLEVRKTDHAEHSAARTDRFQPAHESVS